MVHDRNKTRYHDIFSTISSINSSTTAQPRLLGIKNKMVQWHKSIRKLKIRFESSTLLIFLQRVSYGTFNFSMLTYRSTKQSDLSSPIHSHKNMRRAEERPAEIALDSISRLECPACNWPEWSFINELSGHAVAKWKFMTF